MSRKYRMQAVLYLTVVYHAKFLTTRARDEWCMVMHLKRFTTRKRQLSARAFRKLIQPSKR